MTQSNFYCCSVKLLNVNKVLNENKLLPVL